MTDEEILQSWEANGMDARNRGTEAHLQMQLLVEGLPYRADDPEVVVGWNFLKLVPDEWAGYRCEWEIVYPEADLAGSIDLVIRNTSTGRIIIIDYKRADKLPERIHGYRRRSLPRTSGRLRRLAYAMQLSITSTYSSTRTGWRSRTASC